MRVLVCGTRDPSPRLTMAVLHHLQELDCPLTIIQGECRGIDRAAKAAAHACGWPVASFPADWSRGGRGGPERNQRMLDEGSPRRVLAFHHDEGLGRGTADMVRRARSAGIPVQVVIIADERVSP